MKTEHKEKIYFVRFEGGRIFMTKTEIDKYNEAGIPVKILRKATEKERKELFK